MSVLRQLFVDDRDASIIYFSPIPEANAWMRLGSSNEFMNTTSHAADVGSGLNITFSGESPGALCNVISFLTRPLSGSLIAVFGTISAANPDGRSEPTTQYFLDSSPPISYHAKAIESNQYKVQFYQSPSLGVGTHTLGIILQTMGHFYLDYMVISENFSMPSGDDSISQSALTATSYQHRTTPTPEPSATPSGSTTQRSNSSTGTIVSEILGGILGLVLLLLLSWYIRYLCRKRSGKRWNKFGNPFPHAVPDSRRLPLCQSTSRQLVTPFTLSASLQHRLDPPDANDGAVARITKSTSGSDLAPRLTTSTPCDPPPVYSNPQVE